MKGERAQRLKALTKQPGWADLIDIAEQGKAALERNVLSATWRGATLDEKSVAEQVAFAKALHFLLKQPERAEHRFELAARKEGTEKL